MTEEDVERLQEKVGKWQSLFFQLAVWLFFYIKSELCLWYDRFSRTRCSTHSPAFFLLSYFSS